MAGRYTMHGHPAHLARSPCPLAGTGCFPRRHTCTTPFCGIVPFYKKRDRNASRSLSPIGPDGCNKIRPRCVQPAHAASWRTPKPVFYNATAQPLHLAACIRPHRKWRVGSKMPNCVQSPTDRALSVRCTRSAPRRGIRLRISAAISCIHTCNASAGRVARPPFGCK